MVEFHLPDQWTVVAKGDPRPFPAVPNEIEEVRRALRNPIGAQTGAETMARLSP